METPRYVALCGAPKAGKDQVGQIIANRYGAHIVDTGGSLRRASMALYNLSEADVYTQEGKLRQKEICGQSYTHRELLGELGNLLEQRYGNQFIPEIGICQLDHSHSLYVFTGCRKDQGITYHKHGGIVVEVARPGFFPVHDFDHYDRSLVDYTIVNDGADENWLRLLTDRVAYLFDPIYGGH